VLGILAFGFLAFYIWCAVQGTVLLTTCRSVSKPVASATVAAAPGDAAKPPPDACTTKGSEMANLLDLFLPISGVVTPVALAALAFKPEAPAKVAQKIRGFAAADPAPMSYLDLMIVIYLLVWAVVGVFVCFRTASISLEQARLWHVEWLYTLGRTWWTTALTAVALWMGVPAPKPKSGTALHSDGKPGMTVRSDG
jgi:hypothetical protein